MRKAGPEGMVTETLEIGSGGPGLRALVTRAVGLDSGASANRARDKGAKARSTASNL